LTDVLWAGEAAFKAQLHRLPARMVAPVAGLLLQTSPAIVPQGSIKRMALAPLRNARRPPPRTATSNNKIVRDLFFQSLRWIADTEKNNRHTN